jgi:hypothetical protein
MSTTIYIILLAVIVVLLLGSTWVLNRAAHPKGGDVVAASQIEPADAALARWARRSLENGLTPDQLTSFLLLLGSDQAERSATKIAVKGTKLELLSVTDAPPPSDGAARRRGWRGTLALDDEAPPRTLEVQLDCQSDETTFSIDASLIPQIAEKKEMGAASRGVALIVNAPSAESFTLVANPQSASPQWQSQREGRRSFTLSRDEVQRLRELVRLLLP